MLQLLRDDFSHQFAEGPMQVVNKLQATEHCGIILLYLLSEETNLINDFPPTRDVQNNHLDTGKPGIYCQFRRL